MAAKGKSPLVKPPRTIAELEAELERRTTERDEALARESAIAEVLQVINSSPADLAPVFDSILEKALGSDRRGRGTVGSSLRIRHAQPLNEINDVTGTLGTD
jgi:hypothetical protein